MGVCTRLVLCALALALTAMAGCQQPEASPQVPSIYNTRHVARGGIATAAPTEQDPRLKNYLPVALGDCSEAEWPLFEALSRQPLQDTRAVLTALGLVREPQVITATTDGQDAHPEDRTDDWIANERPKLAYLEAFQSGGEVRWAWVFRGEARPFGSGGPYGPGVALLTTDDFRLIEFKWTPSPYPPGVHSAHDSDGKLVLTYTAWPSKEARLTFSATGIQEQ